MMAPCLRFLVLTPRALFLAFRREWGGHMTGAWVGEGSREQGSRYEVASTISCPIKKKATNTR